MKKFMLFVVLMSFILVGCGSNNQQIPALEKGGLYQDLAEISVTTCEGGRVTFRNYILNETTEYVVSDLRILNIEEGDLDFDFNFHLASSDELEEIMEREYASMRYLVSRGVLLGDFLSPNVSFAGDLRQLRFEQARKVEGLNPVFIDGSLQNVVSPDDDVCNIDIVIFGDIQVDGGILDPEGQETTLTLGGNQVKFSNLPESGFDLLIVGGEAEFIEADPFTIESYSGSFNLSFGTEGYEELYDLLTRIPGKVYFEKEGPFIFGVFVFE